MTLPNPATGDTVQATDVSGIKDHLEGGSAKTAPYHLKQSSGNFQITLPDAAGATQFRLNDSGGVDIFHVDSDGNVTVTGTLTQSGALILPLATGPAQTAEGSVVWDSDDDLLTVGDGSSRKTFYPGIQANHAIVRKTADETVNNSATLQNDDHLVFAIGASQVWVASFYLFFGTLANAAGAKIALDIPAGATMFAQMWGESGSATVTMTGTATDGAGVSFTSAGTTEPTGVWIQVCVVNSTNAGNVQLQWAQASAVASDTILGINSFLVAHRLS